MLRIYLVQDLYNLSDMSTVAEVIDSRAFSNFLRSQIQQSGAGWRDAGPFRNLLIRNNLQEKLFAQVVELLAQRGLILKKGTIVGSTFIESPSSTKNQKEQRNLEADSVKKNNAGITIRYKLNRRPNARKNRSATPKAQIKRREHEKSSVREKLEHVFAGVKQRLRFCNIHYRGLRKQIAKLNIMFGVLQKICVIDRKREVKLF